MSIVIAGAQSEDPNFLNTRRRSSLLAAPKVTYAPFLEGSQAALSANRNEYLQLFKKCGLPCAVLHREGTPCRMMS